MNFADVKFLQKYKKAWLFFMGSVVHWFSSSLGLVIIDKSTNYM